MEQQKFIKQIQQVINDLYKRQLLGPTALIELEALIDQQKRLTAPTGLEGQKGYKIGDFKSFSPKDINS